MHDLWSNVEKFSFLPRCCCICIHIKGLLFKTEGKILRMCALKGEEKERENLFKVSDFLLGCLFSFLFLILLNSGISYERQRIAGSLNIHENKKKQQVLESWTPCIIDDFFMQMPDLVFFLCVSHLSFSCWDVSQMCSLDARCIFN